MTFELLLILLFVIIIILSIFMFRRLNDEIDDIDREIDDWVENQG